MTAHRATERIASKDTDDAGATFHAPAWQIAELAEKRRFIESHNLLERASLATRWRELRAMVSG